MPKNITKIIISILVITNIITFYYFLVCNNNNAEIKNIKSTEEREKWYYFINPLLECSNNFQYINSKTLKSKLENKINDFKNRSILTDVSYYFKLLNDWAVLWLNEDESFIAASLAKLPIAMTYYRLSEDAPGLLDKKITYKWTDFSNLTRSIWADEATFTWSYKVSDLINMMIAKSDNIAMHILETNLKENELSKTYQDLWIASINFDNWWDLGISVKDISKFLRILYNSSYLSRENSEKLLSIMSRWTFKKWIWWAIPRDIIFSNKFWERWYYDKEEKQLHDCWIVYHPKNPYLLCIMTKWKNMDELTWVLKDLSKIVYEDVSSQTK